MVHILPGHRAAIWTVAVSGDGRRAVTGGDDRTVIVWDLATGTALHAPDVAQDTIRAVAVNGDGSLAVIGGGNAAAVVWDLISGKALRDLNSETAQFTSS